MALTPTETRDLLARLGHQPKRFLGQNFLVDGNIVRKSLELARVAAGDAVVEIGPGLGTLTAALLGAGAEVWAVETDRTLSAHLLESLAPRFPGTFHLAEADAVGLPLAGIPAERAPGCKVVANLPYAISSPWMDAVLSGPLPSRMVLMLQREAADRYVASPGTRSFGAISIFVQAAYDTAPGHRVSSSCFHPRPDVDSALLHLVRKATPHMFSMDHKMLIRNCFQQRRKQMGAVIRARLPDREMEWLGVLESAGFSPRVRAEAIPVAVWIRLVSAHSGPA
jgi:16S rRNA (adenine1518-N6/adenine1519-N6)-dimethyltransferase